jgi:hypothetical protein
MFYRTIFFFFFVGILVIGGDMVSLTAGAPSDETNEAGAQSTFYKVYFKKQATAEKIVISMNTVESKYEKGYVIVEIQNQQEYAQLLSLGLKIKQIPDPIAPKTEAIRDAGQYQVEAIPGYPCYRTVEETFASAESIVATYPSLATWTDHGDSWEKVNGLGGYDMKVLVLTNSAITGPKPKIFMTGAIHAREYTTAELVTRLAEDLVNNYGTDADATWMLDHHEVHIMLIANPDGRKQAEAGYSWRKNTNTDYCTIFPTYRGADLNRNFEFKWDCCGGSSDSECDSTYHGAYPASEPETQAIQAYITSQFPDQRGPNDTDPAPLDATGVYIDVHAHGRLVMWPWGWTPDPSPNATELQTLGRKFAYFNNHTPKQGYGLYPTDGTTTTYTYGEFGLASYTFELGTEFFEDCTYFENSILEGNKLALIYGIKVARTPYMTPAGPEAVGAALDNGSTPTGVPAGTSVTLSATMDDTRYNNSNGTEPTQNITAAEYYIDVPPWVTDPVPVPISMSATDGTFDSTVEAVNSTIDTTGWTEGQYILMVRGQDAAGNWGPFSAVFLYINNTVDTDPPTPDPMTWASVPAATGPNSIIMTANTATDPSGVEYYFECLTAGGHDSDWQDSPVYEDTGLLPETQYTYQVKARDKSVNQNETGWSTQEFAVTEQQPEWTQLTYDDFEAGWGNYSDGGFDCRLYTSGTHSHQGLNSADIQDDSGTGSSFYYTNGIDVATPNYVQIKIEFWFKTISMESGEDFWVQYYDGTTWHTVASYTSGTDFNNDTFYNKTVVVDESGYTFPTDMKIRFMCDASGNRDDVYIDEIRVSAK